MSDKTIIYQDRYGAWRWRRVAPNGEIIAVGEGHTRRADAERSAERVFAEPPTEAAEDDAS